MKAVQQRGIGRGINMSSVKSFALVAGLVFGIGVYGFKAAGQGAPGGGAGGTGPCVTYTDASDFEQGNLFNLNIETTPGTQDACLVLKGQVKAWPYIGVANSSRGTISRIAVDNSVAGVSEGDVVGEYLTSPGGLTSTNGGPSPSRTTVDAYGNIWVGNREETGAINNVPHGSVTRVGLVQGGTRGDKLPNGSFSANPNGNYLQGPFTYCTCEDRDNDGLIKTSRGYPHNTGTSDYVNTILPWSNAGTAYLGGVAQAEDECITAYVRVKGTGVRFVSLDPFGDLWTGGNYNKIFEKIDGSTALVDNSSTVTLSNQCSGYGGLVDKENILWSAPGSTMRYDINTNTQACIGVPSYGVGIDPITNHIWTSSGNTINEVDPTGVQIGVPHNNGAPNNFTQGIVVDVNGSVWSAHSISGINNTIGHNKTTGLHVGNVNLLVNPSNANAGGPTGVAMDTNEKIWCTNFHSHNTMRIDPTIGPIGNGSFNIGAVDLVVDLGNNSGPYNYSDMTGSVLLQAVAPQGSWTFIHDGGKQGCNWGTLSWNAITGPNSSVEVRVRASDSPIPSGPWTLVSNNVPFTGVTGRYLQVQVTLHRKAKSQDDVRFCDLTICKEASCTGTVESIICHLDDTGSVTVNLGIFNNSGQNAQHILFTPMPPGSSVTISPNMLLNNPIPDGSSKTVSLTINGLTPGEEFCFIVTLLDQTIQECCSFEVCIDPDCECFQIHPGSETIVCDPTTGEYTYSFQFDNLTPDVLHHLYFFPPAGITITPNYQALVPPVQPNQTSQVITITLSGPNVVPGAEICFIMSIHNVNLLECCSREICITLPPCDVKDPDPDPDKDCHLTAVASCCPNDASTTTVLTICNNTQTAATFPWSIAPSPQCTQVPLSAISPNSGVTPSIQPGQCVNIPITFDCSALQTGVPNAMACLVATVIMPDGSDCITMGKIRMLDDPAPDWCVKLHHIEVEQGPVMPFPGVVDVAVDQTATPFIDVMNLGNKQGLFINAFSATSPNILMDGQYSGQTPNNYQQIPLGTGAVIDVEARFMNFDDVGEIHDLILLADLGGGLLIPVASAGVRSVPQPITYCPGDVTGDTVVNVDDLLGVIAAWGACAENVPGGGPLSTCPADLNCDGVVNVDDLLTVISYWGQRKG